MKNKITRLFALLALASISELALGGTPFTINENFDDPAHFTVSEKIPDGWKTEGTYAFSRNTGAYFGITAKSGDYILATTSSFAPKRNEIVYTPLKKIVAGKPCKISFYVFAPGGNPPTVRHNSFSVKAGREQNAEAQTINVISTPSQAFKEWTLVEGEFTPDTDAEYCFSIALSSSLSSCGAVAIEDIVITGEEPSTEPLPNPDHLAEAVTPPYNQSFDNENHDYDGTTVIPAKWSASSNQAFFTANFSDLPAVTGDYYLISPPEPSGQMQVLYTPYFILKKDVGTIISFYTHMANDAGGKRSLDFTAGTEKDNASQTTLYSLKEHSNEGWELNTVRFTPHNDGAYCFSFMLSGSVTATGAVALEDFKVTTAEIEAKPKASFHVNPLYDITTGHIVLTENQPLTLHNTSKNATSYEWSLGDNINASISTNDEAEPELTVSASGNYVVNLVAKNDLGESKFSKTLTIDILTASSGMTGATKQGANDKQITRGLIPTFSTSQWDFMTGPTHYYRKIAERYEFPQNKEISIQTLNLILTNLKYKPGKNTYETQYNGKFEVIIYGETNGTVDESKEFGRYTSTMAKTFGTSGISSSWGKALDIVFPDPIKAKGNFYVAIVYPHDFDLDIEDENIGCSYLGLGAILYQSGATSLLVKPDSLPGNSTATTGEWCSVDHVDSAMKGYGLWSVMWVSVKNGSEPTGIFAIDHDGKVIFDVRSTDSGFIVSGVDKGIPIMVYNIDGQKIITRLSAGHSTFIPIEQHGTFVIYTKNGTQKVTR